METVLLLIKIITLFYQESIVGTDSDDSSEFVDELLDNIPTPVEGTGDDESRNVQLALRRTIRWMISRPKNQPLDKTDLLQRLLTDCGHDAATYQALEMGVSSTEDDPYKAKQSVVAIGRELRKWDQHRRAKAIIKRFAAPIIFGGEDIDMDSAVVKLLEEIETVNIGVSEQFDPAVISDITVSNLEEVGKIFKQAKEESSTLGVLKTGYTGINRMLGEVGGFRRSEFVLIGALQHNNKTGFTMDLTRQIATFNKPYMRDPKKKPMIMHISSENNMTDNMVLWWKKIKANIDGLDHNHQTVDEAEAAREVLAALSINGYEVNFCRVNPSQFGYRNLFERIKHFENMGYEIHLLTIDYLGMFSKEGCEKGVAGQEYRDLFRRVRNFTSARGICVITPHQLSPAAKMLVRNGLEEDLPRETANKGYWDNCTKIDQEVDVEMIIHIVRVGEESYLCIQRGKHRTISITPERDKYCVYKFEPGVGILDDVNGKDKSRKHVAGETNSDGGGAPWFG
ncbi:DnaB-like replicative helicase [Erwinia phage Ea35-70]|jgi:hypothetical protein|uniref:Divergent DnaB-like ATPase domain-containing protein n=5 Tax=Agricanvirus TaxID=1984776 RepID=W6ATQ0_9CAUD|nr:DnaB-like replicative helicase [Erwinia phage Ea35-70]YP_009605464.1 DnaB-like replicative helicase [Erwinia phage vB_EamM_Deimos-Minion]YP_009606103.1 DnaB-like replicative helicase [Erwinia phage vB_EamM_Simmy50]YP_009622058.1 DnaB-like replicative helicase [Erwinia phage vB_EamM_Desertfox]AUG86104.1 putative DnaB helicase [Erwinia phage vB_EamM_Bosolaphorus]AHI60465.1 hypothetical protein Ea357_311 [Erwinia phage Ea35-70]ANH51778.1 putative helicase [Erwinia phage vB_EamM_Simmy50]ANH52